MAMPWCSQRLPNQQPPGLLTASALAVKDIPGGFFPLLLGIIGKLHFFELGEMPF